MLRRALLAGYLCLLLAPLLSLLAPFSTLAAPQTSRHATIAPAFPSVDPEYIYDQLFYMATHFIHREAGFDTGLPPTVNGHDEFADYWSQEIVRDLIGFGPQARRDAFVARGWKNRPAPTSARNIEVTIPGLTHPEQEVVIGCHYDSETTSTQSAYDDGSGCAIELGVAQAMAAYWRSHALYPARTLRFILFDAEEQGLDGSFHYVNVTANGDLNNIVAMFNEEQNGIAYPLRFLGQAANPQLPLSIWHAPLQNSQVYPAQDRLSSTQRNALTTFNSLLVQAVPAVFAQFRALGYTSLTYRDAANQPVAQDIFTPEQAAQVQQVEDDLAASDEFPFSTAGLPSATFAGNVSYYPEYGGDHPPAWSYPFDQPDDTIQLMNTYASGSSQKAPALTFALALPAMLTTWMLGQADVLGQAPADTLPIGAISDVGQALVGKSLALDATTSFDVQNAPLTYAWSFGDGTTASGAFVSHTYQAAGVYALRLSVSSPAGTRQITKQVTMTTNPRVIAGPFTIPLLSGKPLANPAISIPTPNDGATLSATSPAVVRATQPLTPTVILGIVAFTLLLIVVLLFLWARRRREAFAGPSDVSALGIDDANRDRRVSALQSLADEQLRAPHDQSRSPSASSPGSSPNGRAVR